MNPLIDGRRECSHIPEAHVAWEGRGWRARAYCRCCKVSVRGKAMYGAYGAAEAAAKALVTLAMASAP